MDGVAKGRLTQERKNWRKDKPFGFHARPVTTDDGGVNLQLWKCIVPGKEGTIWEGGYYPVTLDFVEGYPAKPPKAKFPERFFHPNIYPSGTVCLSILNEDEAWKPSITVKQILLGIQELLDHPNELSPAQSDAFVLYTKDRQDYSRRVRAQAALYPPPA